MNVGPHLFSARASTACLRICRCPRRISIACAILLQLPLLATPIHAATLAFSTYFGGEAYEDAFGVAVDAGGYIFITGGTRSSDQFPLLNPL
jgi:hypothetical protein